MQKKITKEDLKQLFEKMQKAGWNMEQPLAWGYFFKHESIEPLQTLAEYLHQHEYEIIDINQSYPDKLFWLQIEKIEQHSVASLDQRNQFFYQLAEKMDIHRYDGMDVSPIDIF